MTAEEGKAVQNLEGLLDGALEQLGREKALELLANVSKQELAGIARLLSLASDAQGFGGDIIYEALAEHVDPRPMPAVAVPS